nr:hypothetical protein [uncultured Dysosmobacter sp.]
MKRILETHVGTVGKLRKALESVPDAALLNIGTESYGYTADLIAYDGMSVAIETKEVKDIYEWPISDDDTRRGLDLLREDLAAYRRHAQNPPNLHWKNEAELAEAMANWTRRAKALAFIFGEEDEP